MDFTKPNFSFTRGGDPAVITQLSHTQTAKDDITTHILTWQADTLRIVQTVQEYTAYRAFYTRLKITNTAASPSPIISAFCDFDAHFGMAADTPIRAGMRMTGGAKIVSPTGSTWAVDEYYPKETFLRAGESKRYANTGGRSSQEYLPFFDVNRGDSGIMLGIGWSGQWFAAFTRGEDDMRIAAGIDKLETYLHANESIETVSTLVMPYHGTQIQAHNQWKRLLKEHFIPIGRSNSSLHAERPEHAPLSAFAWGAMPSDQMLARIEMMKQQNLGFEYYWIDAGWYGQSTQDCPDEFVGDWAMHTGDWRVNTNYHPNALRDVAKAVKAAGMKFLLWFEPSRVVSGTPLSTQHPEWFWRRKNDNNHNAFLLLNLGNADALQHTIQTIGNIIEDLDVDCYREDFNIGPMDYWRDNDEENRRGMCEIGFVNGLYAFWDALLARFPKLLIDTCASGGRRIDLMTIQRAVPLWRSDYMCVWNYAPETAQTHNSGAMWWLPYAGTGLGQVMADTYHFRSAYTTSLLFSAFGYSWQNIDAQSVPFDAIRKRLDEYKQVRPYFSCDYYPISAPPLDMSNWCVQCYDRPEAHDGLILAFRRPDALAPTLDVPLYWLADGHYALFDFDTAQITAHTAAELRKGLTLTLTEKRSALMIRYQKQE